MTVILTCDNGKDHAGPYYTVNMVAYQVGKGCFVAGKKMVVLRLGLGRFCRECLIAGVCGPQGRALLTDKALDPTAD
jgi:hypothetical protein